MNCQALTRCMNVVYVVGDARASSLLGIVEFHDYVHRIIQ
jgi:hypothetical protein